MCQDCSESHREHPLIQFYLDANYPGLNTGKEIKNYLYNEFKKKNDNKNNNFPLDPKNNNFPLDPKNNNKNNNFSLETKNNNIKINKNIIKKRYNNIINKSLIITVDSILLIIIYI